MAKILLVEDTEMYQIKVRQILGTEHQLQWVENLQQATLALKENFDLILLDVELPDGNGFEFFEKLCGKQDFYTPVIFLTGKGQTEDKERGLLMGAHDYVTKPFESKEFKARVASLLKRQNKMEQKREFIRNGDLEFNLFQQKVSLKGQDLQLTPNEFKVLLYLNNHKGKTISRQELIDDVWGREVHVIRRTVDMHISKIRKKLEGSDFRIRPIPKIGYVFSDTPPEQVLNGAVG